MTDGGVKKETIYDWRLNPNQNSTNSLRDRGGTFSMFGFFMLFTGSALILKKQIKIQN
jgi:hypothetical protein